ncbi:terpenoid synthase [Dacryopinax primogenitus]|uniref:(2E,6E)-farnesyl diphosphate synthase n=1 Tax=Dacryopinax primogenitus (strain DJM 731) TaxID=1858805 RepID=M5FZJ4_DACPD|nr:terpenoid synthase [Dacryopinax primogenitus]EJT96922.1 terpenoid synthase [Dacryopinax primogenitus]
MSRYGGAPGWEDAALDRALMEPFTYTTSHPGKDIRRTMIAAFNRWLHVPAEKLDVISRVVNMLHNASLMMDDVEDDSALRRGFPVTHKIYGIPQTINTANYIYFLAYQELFALRQGHAASAHKDVLPEVQAQDVSDSEGEEEQKQGQLAQTQLHAVQEPQSQPQPQTRSLGLDELVTEELINLHRGQGLDLFWRDSLICPTEEEYVNMVLNKTGGLFRLAVKLMMACSESNVDYVPLVNLISVLFQIRDDYANLELKEYSSNKGFAEDLTEGKFSFIVVHSVRADTTNRVILNVLQKRPTTPSTKKYAIEYMRDHTHSFEYAVEVLRSLDAQARREIERLGGNKELEGILDMLKV